MKVIFLTMETLNKKMRDIWKRNCARGFWFGELKTKPLKEKKACINMLQSKLTVSKMMLN